jgi:hypothetical protein
MSDLEHQETARLRKERWHAARTTTGILTGRLLKEVEARNYLGGMSHATLWELRKSGRIPTLRIGTAIYFDRTDLDAFIESIRVEAS